MCARCNHVVHHTRQPNLRSVGRDEELVAPESLEAGEVLQRPPPRALFDQLGEPRLYVGGQLQRYQRRQRHDKRHAGAERDEQRHQCHRRQL